MILGAIRYLIINNFEITIWKLLIELIMAFLDCIFYGYIKGLIQYKYYSIYKCCYMVGFINVPIIIIIYFIVTYIPCENLSCDLEYGKDGIIKKYFDNIYSLFTGNVYPLEIISYIFYSIGLGGFEVLLNETLNNYTIYHTLFIIQIIGFITDAIKVFKEQLTKFLLVIGFGFLEIFFTLVFLEIVELNFCGLDKNLKKRITSRSLIDSEIVLDDINEDNV
jgi:hypothetical protein